MKEKVFCATWCLQWKEHNKYSHWLKEADATWTNYAIAVLLTCVNEPNNDILLVLGGQSRDLTLCIGGQAHEIPRMGGMQSSLCVWKHRDYTRHLWRNEYQTFSISASLPSPLDSLGRVLHTHSNKSHVWCNYRLIFWLALCSVWPQILGNCCCKCRHVMSVPSPSCGDKASTQATVYNSTGS